jgi:oxygen-independent coproporphyrinogen-3 oxidase
VVKILLIDFHTNPPYLGYTYAYPHKTAYRRLTPPVPLRELWADEKKDALFLYIHIPFCAKRCGYCNLFSLPHPESEFVEQYLHTLERQADQIRKILGEAVFSRIAVGGGTPIYLDSKALDNVFDICANIMGANSHLLPVSVETSPTTATFERLAVLKDRGVNRMSIGIQSFEEKETVTLGRSQKLSDVESALKIIRDLQFPTLNIDLIYGIPGQTVKTWLHSVREALQYSPEELYLYPQYIRPLTSLWRKRRTDNDIRVILYREARQLLLDAGYQQVSMRMFRTTHAPDDDGPVYCCQEDGMIGLGCGPRSYTRTLHYSTEYAITARATRDILQEYITQKNSQFHVADYGFRLNTEEQKRRYVIKSLLRVEGLSTTRYAEFFGSNVFEDLPILFELEEKGFACQKNGIFRLTSTGLERSDVIGPWLYSENVIARMNSFHLR